MESGAFEWVVERADVRNVTVNFYCDVIVRILDEIALSTEISPDELSGLVSHHFAYEVEGDAFFAAQSEVWRTLNPGAKHYRFITGNWCLDVIASNPPSFLIR